MDWLAGFILSIQISRNKSFYRFFCLLWVNMLSVKAEINKHYLCQNLFGKQMLGLKEFKKKLYDNMGKFSGNHISQTYY